MKKSGLFVLFALFLGGPMAGCEGWGTMTAYNGYSYYVWVNESDHQITLSTRNASTYNYVFKEILQPGGRFEWEERGAADDYPPPSQFFAKNWTILFDDPIKVVYDGHGEILYNDMIFPANHDQHLNLAVDENYVYEEVKNPNGCSQCPGARYTYTFTNADYEAAMAYSQAQEEEM